MDEPKVSIIVPIYNVENYIRACMDSLVLQTLRDIEIICVDDCGSDTSMSIVEEYAAKDPRVRILRHEKNAGLSAARNTGMAAARAPYIMFCDSDDFYAHEACDKLYAALEQSPSAQLAMCGAHVVHDIERGAEKEFYDELSFSVRYEGLQSLSCGILRNITNAAWGKIYRRAFLEEHHILFPVGLLYEDAYFFYVCAAHAGSLYFIKENLYYYRRRENSIMRNTELRNAKMCVDHLRIVMLLWDYYKEKGFENLWGQYIIELFARWLGFAYFGAQKNKSVTAQIAQMTQDFLKREGYEGLSIPLPIARQLLSARVAKKKRAFGLVKIRKAFWDEKVYVCGVRVWKNAKLLNAVKSVFLEKPHYHMPKLAPYSVSDTALLTELRALGKFTYLPGTGSIEDAAIAAGALHFFDKNHLPYSLRTNSKAKAFVFGGNGDLWSQEYNLSKRIKSFFSIFQQAEKILILPISVQNCPDLVGMMDERFVVFCREEHSYNTLIASGTKARIILDHDIGLRVTAEALESAHENRLDYRRYFNYLFDLSYLPASDTGYFLREDRRSRGGLDAAGLDLVNYSWRIEKYTRDDLIFDTKFMYIMLDRYQNIVTDRLQVAIAAMRLGKQVYLMNDLLSINSSVYQHSLQSAPNIHFVESLPEIPMRPIHESANEVYYQSLQKRSCFIRDMILTKSLNDLHSTN